MMVTILLCGPVRPRRRNPPPPGLARGAWRSASAGTTASAATSIRARSAPSTTRSWSSPRTRTRTCTELVSTSGSVAATCSTTTSELRATFTFQSLDADLTPMGDIGASRLYGQYTDYQTFRTRCRAAALRDVSPKVRATAKARWAGVRRRDRRHACGAGSQFVRQGHRLLRPDGRVHVRRKRRRARPDGKAGGDLRPDGPSLGEWHVRDRWPRRHWSRNHQRQERAVDDAVRRRRSRSILAGSASLRSHFSAQGWPPEPLRSNAQADLTLAARLRLASHLLRLRNSVRSCSREQC